MTLHVCIKKEGAQNCITRLKKNHLTDPHFKIYSSGDAVCIPVLDGIQLPEDLMEFVIEAEGRPQSEDLRPVPVGSYDVIGHIAIIKGNDRGKYISRANEILQSRKSIKTVYLDGGVKGETRMRTLELIAGEDVPEAIYRENGITLKVNVREAYFSPRLATERLLISKSVKNGERICDMFAGIGPFSISIAKASDAKVISIDSNCRAVELLKENIGLNRLIGTIEPWCADSLTEISKHGVFDRIVMNLPHSAFNYVDSAYGSLKDEGIINYYEINTLEGITERMSQFREKGMRLNWKRVVHGYSKYENLYSMEFMKTL